MTKATRTFFSLLVAIALAPTSRSAHAAVEITGTVVWMEVWRTGNVAFTLSMATTSCNGQFILNANEPGTKNIYASLLAAKKTGTPVRVLSYVCGPANGYGSSYNIVEYLYVLD